MPQRMLKQKLFHSSYLSRSVSTSQTTLAGASISTLIEVTRFAALVMSISFLLLSVDGFGGDLQLFRQRLDGFQQRLVAGLGDQPLAVALDVAILVDRAAMHVGVFFQVDEDVAQVPQRCSLVAVDLDFRGMAVMRGQAGSGEGSPVELQRRLQALEVELVGG